MTSHNPLITIITIVYNGAVHIEQTIQSVVTQQYPDYEYIIIDGASTDDTIKTIKEYETQINHWISEPDKGIYNALNKGIVLSKGKYIGICHSGDRLEKGILKKIAKLLESKDQDIFHGSLNYVNTKGKSELRKPQATSFLKRYCSIHHTASFIKRTAFDKVGLFPVDFIIAGDYYWFLKAYLEDCTFEEMDVVVTKFKGGGVSDQNLWRAYFENFKAQQRLFKRPISKIASTFFLLYRMSYWVLNKFWHFIR
ncbi:MAG: glycosyltransferase family 2 protein [Saprospiraceae bacterium]